MPKKATKSVASTVKLRRSKPVEVDTEPLTDDEHLVVDSEPEEQVEEVIKPKKKVTKPRAPRKPKAVVDYDDEKKKFDEYVKSERDKLRAELRAELQAELRSEHTSLLTVGKKAVSNTREERLKLMNNLVL